MKNTSKRQADLINVLVELKNNGKVSATAKTREVVLGLIVKQTKIGQGVQRLIDNNTEIIAGVSDFDSSKFGRTMIVHAIRIRGNDQTLSGVGAVAPEDADFSTNTIPVVVRNANLSIVQGEALFKAPVRSLIAQAAATGNGDDEYEFVKPVVLMPDQAVNFEIEAPAGIATPTVGYLLIELIGSEVIEGSVRDELAKRC